MATLTAGPASLRVDREHGGRISSLTVHGHELLVQPEDGRATNPLLYGCYPMVPFAGRIRDGRFRWGGATHELIRNLDDHAIHGTLLDQRWRIEHAADGYLRLRSALEPHWPFPGWAIQEILLSANRLVLRMEVHSGELPFPATAGWHPWFRRHLTDGDSELTVDVDAKRWYPRGDDGLPLGPLEPLPDHGPWDDCFTDITWPVTLTWPGALEVTMHSTCDHVVIYDEPDHAICVEPQTGPPDAVNLDLARLVRRYDPLVLEAALTWHPL
ncbi:MAG: hypothetical protein WD691_04280 [Acidimicrobiales bacterium]